MVNCILLWCLSWWQPFFGDLLDSLMLLRLLRVGNGWLWGYFWGLSCCFHVILRENWNLYVISRSINCIVIIILSRSTHSWKCTSVCSLILEILGAISPTAAVLLCWSIITFPTSCCWWSRISIIIFTRLLWYFRLMISI